MNVRRILSITLTVIVLIVAGYALAADDAEKKMAAGREALNRAEYEKAAQLMHEVYRLEKQTEAAGNALYWEAFARYRLQRTAELKQAVELLHLQQEKFAHAETAYEGEVLLARLYAEMAERGEVEAITEIERISEAEVQREDVRIQALHALMRMDPEKALPMLEKIVRGETTGSAELQRNALFVLCRSNDQHSEDLLIDLMHTTTDPEMLTEIIMCLSMKGSDRALDAIITLFRESDVPEISEAAMFAIGRNGGEQATQILVEIIRDSKRDPEIRGQALFSLSHSGREQDIVNIATELLQSADDMELMEAALFALSRVEGAVPNQVFMDLINNPKANDEIRGQALFFAARREILPLEFVVGVYEKADNADLKIQVCHAISRMEKNDENLDALIKIARQETDLEIRQNIMLWIGRYDNDKAAAYLMEVITEE